MGGRWGAVSLSVLRLRVWEIHEGGATGGAVTCGSGCGSERADERLCLVP
jgi:hypothetical protein